MENGPIASSPVISGEPELPAHNGVPAIPSLTSSADSEADVAQRLRATSASGGEDAQLPKEGAAVQTRPLVLFGGPPPRVLTTPKVQPRIAAPRGRGGHHRGGRGGKRGHRCAGSVPHTTYVLSVAAQVDEGHDGCG